MNKNKKDYSKGKIYCIRSHKTDLIYVGSTCQPLSKRLNMHKTSYKNYLKTGISKEYSYKMYELDDKPYIELIKNYPCSCLDELRQEEGQHIRLMDCVNKYVAGRTPKEYYEDNKEKIKKYYQDNKDQIKEYQKEYYEDNKDQIKEYFKQYRQANKERDKKYYEDNKDKIKEYFKQYRQANKDKIKEKKNQKFICPCGGKYTKQNKARHDRSNKHKQYIESCD